MSEKISFLGLGGSKCATTEIASILMTSPEIHIPEVKEIYYFNKYNPVYPNRKNLKYSRSYEWYHSNFDKLNLITGEISPIYLTSKSAPKAIRDYNDKMKLFVVLRDPVDRAYSQWKFERQRGIEFGTDFVQSLQLGEDKYVHESLYCQAIKRYLEYFKKEQIHIIFFEDYIENQKVEIQKLLSFLGVINKRDVSYPKTIVNKGKEIRYPGLIALVGLLRKIYIVYLPEIVRHFLREISIGIFIRKVESISLTERKNSTQSRLSEKERSLAMHYFIEDINNLEVLLNVDLEKWKK